MIKPIFYQKVLKAVEIIEKNVKIRFCFSQIKAETVGFRDKVYVTKPNSFPLISKM